MRETFPYKAGVILTLSQLSLTVSLFTNIHTMYSYIIGKFTLTLNGYITHIQMKVNLIIYLILSTLFGRGYGLERPMFPA